MTTKASISGIVGATESGHQQAHGWVPPSQRALFVPVIEPASPASTGEGRHSRLITPVTPRPHSAGPAAGAQYRLGAGATCQGLLGRQGYLLQRGSQALGYHPTDQEAEGDLRQRLPRPVNRS